MKIAIIGYGKMGRMIEEIALSRGHEIVSVIDIDNTADFDSASFRSAEVAIEFTAPHTAYGNIIKCFERDVKVVSGSTGWRAEHGEEIERLCTEQGKTLFWSSNYSLGMAIFGAVNRYLAKIMNGFDGYDVRMEETHHIHKLDAPSGTAITLAENILDNLDRKTEWVKGAVTWPASPEKDEAAPSPTPQQLVIDAVRRDEVPGIHTISYDSEADMISITHDAHSRRGFALGAVLAAEYAAQHHGLLTMSDLFKF